jgi:hypothetical protein
MDDGLRGFDELDADEARRHVDPKLIPEVEEERMLELPVHPAKSITEAPVNSLEDALAREFGKKYWPFGRILDRARDIAFEYKMKWVTRKMNVFPNVLCIALKPKRSELTIPHELDASPYARDGNAEYALAAVIAESRGHFVAYTRRGGLWSRYDDDKTVVDVHPDYALEDAYVLFYVRKQRPRVAGIARGGIPNIGNSCGMGSILQCLFVTPYSTFGAMKVPYEALKLQCAQGNATKETTNEFRDALLGALTNQKDVSNEAKTLHAAMIKRAPLEVELVLSVLLALCGPCGRIDARKYNEHCPFEYQEVAIVTKKYENHTSVSEEKSASRVFFAVADFGQKLESVLGETFTTQDNGARPEGYHQETDTKIARLPQVLCIHLGAKNTCVVPLDLNMAKYTLETKSTEYALVAVVSHEEEHDGHYVASVRHPGSWWRFDDAKKVEKIPQTQATKDAVLLFYRRKQKTAL